MATKRLLALLALTTLIAAGCGSDSEPSTEPATDIDAGAAAVATDATAEDL